MRTGRFILSSSWSPVVAASSAVVQTATTAVSFASTAESCVQATQATTTLRLTSGAASLRRVTSRARSPLRASGKLTAAAAAFQNTEATPRSDPAADASASPIPAVEKPAEAEPAPRPATEVRLEIDGLQYYDLIKPIPVVIRTLGERAFEAEVAELNLSTTSSSLPSAFLGIKEQIVSLLERHRGKKSLNPERQLQLAALEKYISGPRRNWYPR